MPMVVSVAHAQRRSTAVDHEELTQEGVVGLLRALERYEPERGAPFWAYAACMAGTRTPGARRRVGAKGPP